MRKHGHAKSGGNVGMVITSVLFLLVLAMLALGITNLSGSAGADGVSATRQAIERATVLCYATEGYYPPSLSYIEETYGVQIDYARYSVRYEVFAANNMPVIQVIPK
jgi:hypothetical protein